MGLFRPGKKDVKDTTDQVTGGFAFFLSLFFLLPTGVLFLGVSLSQLKYSGILSCCTFLCSLCAGVALAHYCIKGHISVLIHEWKHQVVSSLVGNKNKKMEIKADSGSLQYEYTEQTAHYNAFIALAPYILPVFTSIGALITVALQSANPAAPIIIIGIAYGVDVLINARDISPVQTDLSLIRGGFYVGLLYVVAWNMIILALVLAWAFNGFAGITALFESAMQLFISLYSAITGWTPPDIAPETIRYE